MPREPLTEYPTLQRIRDEVGWNPHDDEPTNPETLERYISALEAQTRAADMIGGRDPIAVLPKRDDQCPCGGSCCGAIDGPYRACTSCGATTEDPPWA
jgi:hypothetical protein